MKLGDLRRGDRATVCDVDGVREVVTVARDAGSRSVRVTLGQHRILSEESYSVITGKLLTGVYPATLRPYIEGDEERASLRAQEGDARHEDRVAQGAVQQLDDELKAMREAAARIPEMEARHLIVAKVAEESAALLAAIRARRNTLGSPK